jgi:hypothetical protein
MILLAASFLSTIGIAFKMSDCCWHCTKATASVLFFDHYSIDGERSILSAGLDFSIVIINFVSQ